MKESPVSTSLAIVIGVALAGFFFGLTMPAPAQDISTDYDHSAAFAKVRTYTWAKVQTTDPLVEPRLTAAVDHILQQYGWHLVAKNADVAVSAADFTGSAREYSSFYRSLEGYDWHPAWRSEGDTAGFTESIRSPRQVHPDTLVIDLYNLPSHKLMWRGMATEPLNVSEKVKQDTIDKTTAMVFAKFAKSGAVPNQVGVADSQSSQMVTGGH